MTEVELQAALTAFEEKAISTATGISPKDLRKYPRVRAFVDQHLDSMYLDRMKKQEEPEEMLLPRTEEAVQHLELVGKPVTFQAVGKYLGIGPATLKSYPRVVALLEQHGYTKRLQSSARAEEFFSRVLHAIQACRASGQPITKDSLSSKVGVNRATFAGGGVKNLIMMSLFCD